MFLETKAGVNKLFIIWPFHCGPEASDKKKHVISMSWRLEPALQSGDIGQRQPFWQLSIDYNMDVNKDVHYQVKRRLFMPWTPS